MKKEALVRKLEEAEMPVMLVEGHRQKLRGLLLERYLQGQHPAAGKGSRAGGIRDFLDWLRAPAWRAAAASGMVVMLVAAALAVVFYSLNPSPAVVAADVVRNDPSIQQKLTGTGEILIVRVDVRDGMASVICCRGAGDFIEADVDISVKTVVQTRRYEGLFMPELPADARDKAIRAAVLDERVKPVISKGGKIGHVFPIFTSITGMSIVNGGYLKVTPEATRAVVPVILDGNTWLVQVNLEGMAVERVMEQQSMFGNLFNMFYCQQKT